MKKTFESIDGIKFDSRAECKNHEEAQLALSILKGAHEEDIQDAFDLKNQYVSDALERIGNIISKKRWKSGIFKRRRRSDLVKAAFLQEENAPQK